MKWITCDACGKDSSATDYEWNKIELPCHIADPNLKGRGYIDKDGNQCSGRLVDFDLCNKCANKVHDAAYAMIQTIKLLSYRDEK